MNSVVGPQLTFVSICCAIAIGLAAPASNADQPDKGDSTPGAAANDRVIVEQVTVKAPLDAVWNAWTTSEGMSSFFAEKSTIELRPGGKYELWISAEAPEGSRGSEGCRVLCVVPKELLCFEWNYPPKVAALRAAGAKADVAIEFKETGKDAVIVTLTHQGFPEGEYGDAALAYFGKAWPYVLDNLKKTLEASESDREKPSSRYFVRYSLETTEGHVNVVSVLRPERRQEFTIELPASIENVWAALATGEGMKSVFEMQDTPEIELKPWGKYAVWPGASNKVLSVLPGRMLATSGSAPPQFPTVREGGTWGVYFLEPLGKDKTKLRLVTLGWQSDDEEWEKAYDYFLKANPQYLNALHAAFEKAAK